MSANSSNKIEPKSDIEKLRLTVRRQSEALNATFSHIGAQFERLAVAFEKITEVCIDEHKMKTDVCSESNEPTSSAGNPNHDKPITSSGHTPGEGYSRNRH